MFGNFILLFDVQSLIFFWENGFEDKLFIFVFEVITFHIFYVFPISMWILYNSPPERVKEIQYLNSY